MNKMWTISGYRWMAGFVLAGIVGLGACGDSTGPEDMAQIRVLLTDEPADYLSVAMVCISEVYLQPGEEDESPPAVLWEKGEGDAQCFDLLELQGVSATLVDAEVEAGTYAQLRLVVESASVTLAGDLKFAGTEDNEMDLVVPSGPQTGIKVQLLEPVFAENAILTEITLDADVNLNFVIQGDPPAGILGVLFTPHLVEIEGEEII